MKKFGRLVSLISFFPVLHANLAALDDPELYDGAHVSVQIVGRRFQEEKVLAITEYLGDALGKHVV